MLGLPLQNRADAPARLHRQGVARPPLRHEATVLTLNIAHGRGRGFHQSLQGRRRRTGNIHQLRTLLHREEPDLVAIQEIDAPSWWSGSADQMAELMAEGDLHAGAQGVHVHGFGLQYGTALLAGTELREAEALVFPAGFASPAKGATIATWRWDAEREVTAVSLHLDFLSKRRRRDQIRHLVAILRRRGGPYVVMGDFNCTWKAGSAVRDLCEGLELEPWRPESTMATFRSGARLDWILASAPLRIESCEVMPDVVSDHAAVSARLTWKEA